MTFIEIINKALEILNRPFPGFTSSPKSETLPPPPTLDDPAVAAAKEKLRLSEKRRKGRRASVLSSGQGENTGVIKRSAALGGQDQKLAVA